MKEYWVPITGYEGWYEISTAGRIRSVDRVVKFKNGKGSRHYKGQILKFRYHNGYAMVNLNKNKVMKEHYVHRLVIENFTLHPKRKPWVNHKNGVKSDNSITNLEWCTPSENNIHAVKMGIRRDNVSGLLSYNNSRKRAVGMVVDDEVIYTGDCTTSLAKQLLKDHILKDASIDQAARAIQYACKSGRKYQGKSFKYI